MANALSGSMAPGAVEQVPIFITGQVAEPGHRLDLKRRRADKARRLAAGKIVSETHNGLFVALAFGVRIGSMPKNVSKHGEPPSSCEPVNAPGDRPWSI